MKPAQAFGVAVRVIGLLLLLISLLYIASGAFVWALPNYRPNLSSPWHYVMFGLFLLLVGLFFLRRDRIVSFAYRNSVAEATDV
jgi:hypothetical protein